MSSISSGERLTDIILSNRMTKKEFAESLGYNPSYITQICRDVKPPSEEFALKIEKLFGVSAEWLLNGKDSKKQEYSSPVKEAVIRKVSRMSSDEDLHAVLAFINCLNELPKTSVAKKLPPLKLKDRPNTYSIPIKGEVAAGNPIIAYEMYDETVESNIRADSALYIRGKSMEPDYPDGCIILINENAYISNGDVVVALIMRESEVAEATCKIFEKNNRTVYLRPINDDYEIQVFNPKSGCEIRIFGKVVGQI